MTDLPRTFRLLVGLSLLLLGLSFLAAAPLAVSPAPGRGGALRGP